MSTGEACEDAAIIRRALRAYKVDRDDASRPSSMWAHIFNTQQRSVHEILVGDDSAAITRLFRRPGESNLFYGFDGIVVDFVNAIKSGAKEFGNSYATVPHDHLIRFAEVIGALRYENIDGWFIDPSHATYGSTPTDQILDALDRFLGVELQYKMPFADEYGAKTSRGIISFPTPQALYHAWRARELVKSRSSPKVLEIGGGLGRAAYFAWQLGLKDYTIIDLPLTSLAQADFLMRVVGEDNVVLHGEEQSDASSKIKLLHPSDFLNGHERYDLILNANSLTEMSRDAATNYWEKIRTSTSRFLSMNHEANEFTVCELAAADHAHVKSSQRHPYGMRKSYAEELFEFV